MFIYGMDKFMDGTTYSDDTAEPHDKGHAVFIGSASLLLEADIGSRVHYEGRQVIVTRSRGRFAHITHGVRRGSVRASAMTSQAPTMCTISCYWTTQALQWSLCGEPRVHVVREHVSRSRSIHSLH